MDFVSILVGTILVVGTLVFLGLNIYRKNKAILDKVGANIRNAFRLKKREEIHEEPEFESILTYR